MPTPTVVEADDKKSLTITFTGDDLALYDQLQAAAEVDDRTLPKYTLRLLRTLTTAA